MKRHHTKISIIISFEIYSLNTFLTMMLSFVPGRIDKVDEGTVLARTSYLEAEFQRTC